MVIRNRKLQALKQLLFSYGSLQKEKLQIELFGRTLLGWNDSLAGYRLASIEIKDAAFLAKGQEKYQQTFVISNNRNDTVKGTVFEIAEEELLLADKYEPVNYKRIKVVLQSGKEAWVYFAVA